jgi:hypothetical protein
LKAVVFLESLLIPSLFCFLVSLDPSVVTITYQLELILRIRLPFPPLYPV